MRLISLLVLASSASAITMPNFLDITQLLPRKDGGSNSNSGSSSGSSSGKDGSCPSVWSSISSDLTQKFLSGGQCNPDARAAIRAIFHDCGAWSSSLGATHGCDGSLATANELGRNENRGLANIVSYLQSLANSYSVSVADMIVFAGNHAIVTCPGGPRVQTYIGRKDSQTPAPDGLLPDVNAPAADLLKLFQDKGFDEVDLAALLGAHSTSNQFNFDTAHSGTPQDSTPGVWDVKYYGETLNPPAGVTVFPSDAKLSQYARVGKEFKGFVNNQGKWNGKFASAMAKMALFGSGGSSGMADCTKMLPKATNVKREMRAMDMFKPRN